MELFDLASAALSGNELLIDATLAHWGCLLFEQALCIVTHRFIC